MKKEEKDMNCECLVLVKGQPTAKDAWNEAIKELGRDPWFCDDENVWIRDKAIEGAEPEIPSDQDAGTPYGFQRVSVRPYDFDKPYDKQPKPIWLTLPKSRKAKDAGEAFMATLEKHIDFFTGNDYVCAIVDPNDLSESRSASGKDFVDIVVCDPKEAGFADEIRKAGQNDWLFFVNYHGC